jgi:hypothetical protein
MGFKMNGSPAKMGTIQGTAGHSSALKMKVEENASALKQKAYGGAGKTWGEYNKASGGALNTDTKTQKEYEAKMRKENPNWDKKKDNTWKMQQNKINKHVGSKVVHSVDEIENNIKATATSGGDGKQQQQQQQQQELRQKEMIRKQRFWLSLSRKLERQLRIKTRVMPRQIINTLKRHLVKVLKKKEQLS